MKKKRMGATAFSLQILLFIAMNVGGDQLASGHGWPVWLDSVGTILCTYLYGPFCGSMVGITFNLLIHILYGAGWYYALVSVVISLVIGYAAKRKMLETFLDTMTVSAMLAGGAVASSYPLNLLMNGARTGNIWGDAVIGFFGERGLPRWLSLLLGQMYVELIDKFLILVILFLILRLASFSNRIREKRRNAGEQTEHTAAGQVTAGLLAVMLAVGAAALPARAEEDAALRTNYDDYVQTIYSTSNGLPCGEANDIAMTGDGIIWIGTYAGLYRYNGRAFQWMNGYDSVRNVNCLYVDEEGRLWIGTNDNGLSIVINEKVANVIDQERGLPANSVKAIIKSTDGYYYIGTTGAMQVLTLNNGLRRVATISEIRYADHLAAGQDGYVAAVNNEGTLFLLRQGQVVFSRKLSGSGTVFKSCTFTPEGELLAATTGNEIYRFSREGDLLSERETAECPGLQNIKTLRFLDSGELFVCADNGIACFGADGTYEKINTNDFNNSIDNMLVDFQGNLWFTSSRLGLLRMAPSNFRDIFSVAGMENRVVNAIVQWQGAYYFGTDKGMEAVDPAGKNRIENEITKRFEGIRIRCLLVDREDHLWVCTYGSGLMELEPDGTEHLYNEQSGAFGNRARVVHELSDGTIVAAGDTGISFIRDHRVEDTITRSGGKITSMVLTIMEQEDGSILVGTDGNGIAVLEDRQVSRILTRANGLSSEVILRLIPDGGTGGVFVVTSNGLCYMGADGNIRKLDNFPYFNNYDIWMKGSDSLFVLSSAGIYIVDRNDLLSGKEDLRYELLDTRRGLTGSLTANAWTWYDGKTGNLYLPCDTGVFVLNTGSFLGGSTLYRMKITGIRMDGTLKPMERYAETRIPRGSSRVEILPEVVNYSIQDPYVGYMLEGFDTDWTIVPQNQLSTIVYTNLPVGSFTFHLAVFDNSRESILSQRNYQLVKEREIYDDPSFIIYLMLIPMFTVCWVTFLMARRRNRKIQAELELANRQIEMGKQTVAAIARTVDAKDKLTNEHSKRVAIYSKQIAKAYGMDEKQCQDIEWAASMHDIGKIAIPDRILNKDSRLTDEEYEIMKTHTTEGAKILEGFTLLDNVIEGAEFHHERFDGKGYPKGLKGLEIPLYARIIGVADAFDAMTAKRVYRKQMDFDYVLGELERGKGTQFDPQFVDILLKLIREGIIDLNQIYHIPGKAAEDTPPAEEPAEDKPQTGGPAEEKKEALPADPESPEKGGRA